MSSVLVVDDEPENFDVIEMLLFKERYSLSYASSGHEALSFLESCQPDVILLDVMIPDINGIEICSRIKSNPNWHHIPIIIVTALNSKEDLARCLDAGADDFVSKPVSGTELRARIRSMLRIKKQYDALELALKSLKSACELREDMTQMIVHDLRNPISNIFLFAELLSLTNLQNIQRQRVEQILISAQQLRSLTDDLLVMSKLESGKIALNRIYVDICYIAQEVLLDFQGLSQEKNIQLIGYLPEEQRSILLDFNLFRRLLDNLLSNALKFAPSNSKICLQIEYLDNPNIQSRICVYDEGPGITEEMRQRIFEKYEVGHLMSGVTQIGLGLAFCKMVVEAHGGRIFVEPNHPQGSVFIVEI